MECKKLTLSQLEEIYKSRMTEDFPRNELKPLGAIKRALEAGQYDCLGLFDGSEILGYAFFVKCLRGEKYDFLLDYLAIEKTRRNTGLGTKFLSLLPEYYAAADTTVCEVEDPVCAPDAETAEIQQRRLDFYLKNGCIDTGAAAKVFGVDYRILQMSGKDANAEDIEAIYSGIYKSMLPCVIYKMFFKLKDHK